MHQENLFSTLQHDLAVEKDGRVRLVSAFLNCHAAQQLFEYFHTNLAWREEVYSMYGRKIIAPRLVAWYGNQDAVYQYSGVKHEPLAWDPKLKELRDSIAILTQCDFNSVLANFYRNGKDSMGWHADKEKELGPNPTIASLSFGATRLFKVRHNKTRETIKISLGSGSLLIMDEEFQHHWQHSVPKTSQDVSARINLTFRQIVAKS